MTTVFNRWETLVGPDIAAHARPESLRDGHLVLVVDHPAWATQLRFMTADLLARLAEVAGASEVSDIRIKVAGEQPKRGREKGR
jgi:predicted nucleic acid-binding Zn ribbon protein